MNATSSSRGALLALLTLALVSALLPSSAGAATEPGAVYTMTNSGTANEVVAYARAADGTLTQIGTYPTGGTGSGEPRLGSQNPVLLTPNHRWLFVVNPGSDDVSVFAVAADGSLTLTDRQSSNGDRPESVTIRDNLVYVLNSGQGNILPGERNNISGFTFERRGDRRGQLRLLSGSRRMLSQPDALPAQVAFSPDGRTLVVTERNTNRIDTFRVTPSGRPRGVRPHDGAGIGPFGFAFRDDGVFIVTDSANGAANQAAASSYALPGDRRGAREGDLRLISSTVANTQTDVCWVVITNDERYAYITNNGSGTISSYTIAADGSISLLDPAAGVTGTSGGFGTRDVDLDDSGSYLYAIDVGTLTMNAFTVNADGSLTKFAAYAGLPGTFAGAAAY